MTSLSDKLFLREPTGEATVWSPKRGLICTEVQRTLTAAMAATIIRRSNEVIAEAGVVMGFHDWWLMTGYETEARKMLTVYVGKIHRQVSGVHLLAHSKMVVMGINVANIALKRALKAYGEAAPFEAAFNAALATP